MNRKKVLQSKGGFLVASQLHLSTPPSVPQTTSKGTNSDVAETFYHLEEMHLTP